MSIVCTLEPKLNLFKGSSSSSSGSIGSNQHSLGNTNKNLFAFKNRNHQQSTTTISASSATNNLSNCNSSTIANEKNFLPNSVEQHYQQQQYKPRITVAEFVDRQQQLSATTGVPVSNGEKALSQRIITAMPEILNIAASNNHNNNSHNNKLTVITSKTTTSAMNNMRLSPISPSLSTNGSSNEGNNGHLISMYGPMSPQSSDSGNSMSDMNSNGKYSASFNGPYDNHNMSQQARQAHKELFSQRKQREFTPDNKKDDSYWDRRRRNNEAAKRSREKRRYNDMVLEQRVVELTKENHVLKAQLEAIRDKFNISGENLVSVEQIMASLPTSEQVLSITKRAKLQNNGFPSVVPTATSVPSLPSATVFGTNSTTSHQGSNNGIPQSALPLTQNKQQANIMSEHCENSSKITANPLQHHVIKSVSNSHIPQTFAQHTNRISPLTPHMQMTNGAAAMSGLHYQSPRAADIYDSNGDCAMPERRSPSQNNVLHSHNSINPTTAINSHSPMDSSLHRPPTNLQNLHVLQALNRNCDDLDNLRKVVAVVGAITNGAGTTSSTELPLYNGPQATHYANQHSTNGYTYGNSQNLDVSYRPPPSTESAVSSSATEAVTSSSASNNNTVNASVLNLSRRDCSPSYEHMLSSTTSSSSSRLSSLSSASSTGAVSGDEHEHDVVEDIEPTNIVVNISTTISPISNDSNNCLPLKLRHKSHLGDKDAAATALLALQHIKQEQEPNSDNSSDERDSGISGISIASSEWTSQFQRKVMVSSKSPTENSSNASTVMSVSTSERDHLLKSQLARLESEVANIKSMMILSSDQAIVTSDIKI